MWVCEHGIITLAKIRLRDLASWEKHGKIRSATECSNLRDFCVVFVHLVRHAFCYFIWHV